MQSWYNGHGILILEVRDVFVTMGNDLTKHPQLKINQVELHQNKNQNVNLRSYSQN